MGRVVGNSKAASQSFGLKTAIRTNGRDTSFQFNKREAMNFGPGGTLFDSWERGIMVVCGQQLPRFHMLDRPGRVRGVASCAQTSPLRCCLGGWKPNVNKTDHHSIHRNSRRQGNSSSSLI